LPIPTLPSPTLLARHRIKPPTVLGLSPSDLAVLILKIRAVKIFVVKILGTGVALEIDDGSVAKVLKQTHPRDWSEVCLCGGGLLAYAVDMGSCARYNDDING
jgi:hypothetical protein